MITSGLAQTAKNK